MFRSGRIGFALLIIRLSLVGTLSLHAFEFGASLSMWSLVALIAAAMVLGAMTTLACLLNCAAELGLLVNASHLDVSALIASIPLAIALAFLGPGAYSLDARIFGRRIIVVSPDDDNS